VIGVSARYYRRRRRRPSDPFDLNGLSQREKAERTYRVLKHVYKKARNHLGPRGRRFESGLVSHIVRTKKKIAKTFKPRRRKPAAEF